jgi:heme o synthase
MGMSQHYYAALKPERTYANVMTTGAGFLFASRWQVDWMLLLATLLGTTLVVMSACAVNNCTDRGIDARMPRTDKRATVSGAIPLVRLAILAAILGVAGFAVLAIWVNWLTVALGLLGYVDYVVLYAWAKRTTPWSTLVGTVSGAVPLVAGYVAVSDHFNATALALGLVMVCWQMPHFYAISIFRLKDYRAGGIPVWPVRYGIRQTQAWILGYTVLYLAAVMLLSVVGSAGVTFAGAMGVLGLYWVWLGVKGFRTLQPEKWARGMFGFSLLVLLVFCLGVASIPLLV